jgi:hypothetical protein
MAVFSTNSVRQLYVANAASGSTAGAFATAVKTVDNELYLTLRNSANVVVATPIIPIDAIVSAKVIGYAAKTLRKDTITFAAPVVGQTYTLRIVFRNWGSGSAENQYIKNVGSYKAKTGDTQESLVDAFIASAAINFAREPIELLKFTKNSTGSSATLSIEEVAQPFVRGKQQGRPLNYYIQYVEIKDANGNESYAWGTAASNAKGYAGQGTAQLAADQEYFYLGERGDKYRQVGYPYTFDTTYLVDSTKVYDTIDIAYTSKNPGALGAHNDQRVLTILAAAGTSGSVDHTIANAITAAVNVAIDSTLLNAL